MPTARSLPVVLFLAACGTADARESLVSIDSLPGGIPVVSTAAPIDSGMWSLVPERDVRPPAGSPGEILDPTDLALTDDGTLIVAESGPAVLNIYGPDGNYLRSISRDGDGPGEFRVGYIAVRGDTVVVQDPRNTRATSLLLSDGSVVGTRATSCCYYAPIAIDDQGRAWARTIQPPDTTSGPGQGFVRFPLGGTSAESLIVLERKPEGELPYWRVGEGEQTRMMVGVPMLPQSIHEVHRSGALITGWNGEYRLRFSRTGRDTARIFTRPWTPDPVTPDEKQEMVDQRVERMLANNIGDVTEEILRRSFDPAKIPDQRPAYERVWSDPTGRIWVRLPKADTEAVHLDLFDANGQWLDQLRVTEPGWTSRNFTAMSFSSTHLALLLEDDDGLPFVRIFRIVRKDD